MTGRIRRLLGRPDRRPHRPTAFVLGGGGNLGAKQVGMLKALVERGIVPDLVVGCSVGAINGAALAADPTPAGVAGIEDLWRAMDGRQLAPPFRLPLPLQLVRRGLPALHPNDGLRAVIEGHLAGRRFDDLVLPFHCVATSLDDGTARWFTSGPLTEPLLASAAIPAVYPPVEIDGVRYVDGGVTSDVPVGRAYELGVGRIHVLYVGNLERPRPQPRRPIDVALEASWIARAAWFRHLMADVPAGVDAVLVPGGETPALRYDDFTHTAELIDAAYEAAAAFLDGRTPPTPEPSPAAPVEDTELIS